MKYFNILATAVLPALLLSAGIQANEPARDKDDSGASLEGQAADPILQGLKERLFGPKPKGKPTKEDPSAEGAEKKEKPIAEVKSEEEEEAEAPAAGLGFMAKIKALFQTAPKSTAEEYQIVAMGDVEGSWAKVKSFIASNKVVELDKDDNFQFKDNDKTSRFVCLGDTVDKGPDNRKILKALVDFKERKGDRVILILGNRDINKLRLNWELSEAFMNDNPGTDRVSMEKGKFTDVWSKGYQNWLTWPKQDAPKDKKVASKKGWDDFVEDNGIKLDGSGISPATRTRLQKLAWLTANTYGAPDFYQNLKAELKKNDDDTMDYILGYAKEDGDYSNYQKLAQIIYYDEPTKTIFTHGGIFYKKALGAIPGRPPMKVTNNKTLMAWIDDLNSWAHTIINIGAQLKIGADKSPNIQRDIDKVLELIAYQEPTGPIELTAPNTVKEINYQNFNGELWTSKNNDESSAVGRPMDDDKNFSIDNVPVKELSAAGVLRMVVGHTPVGEVPVVARKLFGLLGFRKIFEVVDADTSFSTPPRVAAVTIGQKSGVYIEATYNNEPLKYLGLADKDLGRSRIEKRNIVNPDKSISTKKAIYWNQGIMKDGKRLEVSFFQTGRNQYATTLVK